MQMCHSRFPHAMHNMRYRRIFLGSEVGGLRSVSALRLRRDERAIARGVNCSTHIAGTPSAFCNVVIRASITDPATNATRRSHFLVTVRNP